MTSSGHVLPLTEPGWLADVDIDRGKHAPSVGVPISLELAALVMRVGTFWPTPSGPASVNAPPLIRSFDADAARWPDAYIAHSLAIPRFSSIKPQWCRAQCARSLWCRATSQKPPDPYRNDRR
jgi:hypothetical protein